MQKREMDSQPPSPSPDSFFVNKVMHWNISVHTHQSLCAAATEDLMTLGLSLVTASLIHKRKRTNRLYVIYILDCIRLVWDSYYMFLLFFFFSISSTVYSVSVAHSPSNITELNLLSLLCLPDCCHPMLVSTFSTPMHPCTPYLLSVPPPSLATNYAPFWAELRV